MTKKYLITLIFLVILGPLLLAETLSFDPSNNLFSARNLGLGGCSIGFANDANGVFLNPAGMGNFAFPQLSGMSRKMLLEETQYNLLTWAMPTNIGTFGIGYVGISTGGSLPTMRDPGSARIIVNPSMEAMGYGNSVIGVSYSKKIRPNLSWGTTLKFLTQYLDGSVKSSAKATDIDLAVLYQHNPWLEVGANLQNMLSPNLAWDGGSSDKVGGLYKLGCKINVMGSSYEAWRACDQKLIAGIDYAIPHQTLATSAYHLGLEYIPYPQIALRTGFDQHSGISFGVGLVNGAFRFDYAYAVKSNIPGDTPHYFTLSYIGDRVMTITKKFKKYASALKFISPPDRFITDMSSVEVVGEARSAKIMDQTNTWTVTALSASSEIHEITEYSGMSNISFNNMIINKPGTFESVAKLYTGRNSLKAFGYTPTDNLAPKPILLSAEVTILRFSPFVDINMEHWAIEPIALCSTLDLVKGYPDNSFKPDKGITRAELVTLLVRSLPLDIETLSTTTPFKDVNEEHWAAQFVGYGAEHKMVLGYPDKTFRPKNVLTRAEGIAILARYAGLSEEAGSPPPFPDLKDNYWANKYIGAANKYGMLVYLVARNFEPSTPFTRAEACEVLYRTPTITQRVNNWWETGNVTIEMPKSKVGTKEAQTLTKPATSESKP